MNLREAAQMALDAMLNFPDDISDDMFESIKALRAALAQPEREWQGMTDEEISNIWGEPVKYMYSGHYNAIRAIEAKLKEKNT